MAPDRFETSILLLNATSGAMRVLTTLAGVALKGMYCLDADGRYHFTMRDATSHSLVTVGLVSGHVQRWADKAFGNLLSMHCLNFPHHQGTAQGRAAAGAASAGHSGGGGAASSGESPATSSFNLIGVFPSPTPDAVSQDEGEAAAANLWFLGITHIPPREIETVYCKAKGTLSVS